MTQGTGSPRPGEQIVEKTRLHWVAMAREILYLAGILVLVIVLLAATDLPMWVYLLLIAAGVAVSYKGVAAWLTTEVVITNHRLIFRQGWLTPKGHEVPIERITRVAYQQNGMQRAVGAGDILVERADLSDRTAMRNVAAPAETTRLLTQLAETRAGSTHIRSREPIPEEWPARQNRVGEAGAESGPMATAPSRAEQLDILARLHERGMLTDEEFAAEKARVLKEG